MPHHKADKKEICAVSGCKEEGVRSIPRKKLEANTDFSIEGAHKRVHICKEHYKEYKKATKKDRDLERMGWEK